MSIRQRLITGATQLAAALLAAITVSALVIGLTLLSCLLSLGLIPLTSIDSLLIKKHALSTRLITGALTGLLLPLVLAATVVTSALLLPLAFFAYGYAGLRNGFAVFEKSVMPLFWWGKWAKNELFGLPKSQELAAYSSHQRGLFFTLIKWPSVILWRIGLYRQGSQHIPPAPVAFSRLGRAEALATPAMVIHCQPNPDVTVTPKEQTALDAALAENLQAAAYQAPLP